MKRTRRPKICFVWPITTIKYFRGCSNIRNLAKEGLWMPVTPTVSIGDCRWGFKCHQSQWQLNKCVTLYYIADRKESVVKSERRLNSTSWQKLAEILANSRRFHPPCNKYTPQRHFTKNIGLLKKKINTGHFHIITTLTVLNIWISQQSRPQALVVKYLLFSSHMLWNQTKAKLSEFPYSLSSTITSTLCLMLIRSACS